MVSGDRSEPGVGVPRRVPGILWCVVAAAVLLTGCTSNAVSTGSFVFVSPGGKTEFTYPAPERQTIGNFTGTSVTAPEMTIQLADFPDTILVLNFWASWCGPCRAETPGLEVVSDLHHDDGVQFLGINIDDDRQAGADFISTYEVGFPSIFDPTSRTLLSIRGFPAVGKPHTIVLDRQHRVAHIFLGAVGAQELDEVVTALVAEGA